MLVWKFQLRKSSPKLLKLGRQVNTFFSCSQKFCHPLFSPYSLIVLLWNAKERFLRLNQVHPNYDWYCIMYHLQNAIITQDLQRLCRTHLLTLPFTFLISWQCMFYSGQLDIIVGAALTENFLQGLAWAGQDGYLNSNKTIWKVDPSDTEVAGFVRRYKEFYQVGSILSHHLDTVLCKLVHSATNKILHINHQ